MRLPQGWVSWLGRGMRLVEDLMKSEHAAEIAKVKQQLADHQKMQDWLVLLVKHFEQFYANPYICPAGKRTVGYGHVIVGGEPPFPWTEEQASSILLAELEDDYLPKARTAWDAKSGKVWHTEAWDDLPPQVQAAVVSLVYNAGPGAVTQGSWPLKQGDAAREAYYGWSKGGGKRLPGLVRRRFSEWKLAETGELDLQPAGWQEWYESHK